MFGAFFVAAIPVVVVDPNFLALIARHPALAASYPTLVATALLAYREIMKRRNP